MKTVDNVEKNKKKGSKKLLLIIPIVIVVVLILAFIFGEKVPKVDETDGIKMTADEIAEKFLNDKSGMDKEFHNKVYEVTGNVEDSNGQYSMTLSTESGEYEIYFDVDKEKSNKIPKLDKGDTVTMKGLYNRVLTDRIDFKDALYIASEKATEAPTEEITEPETTEETTEAPTEINPEEYKSECQDISYSEIARDSNGLAGQYFTFTGKIIQVMDGTYRMNVTVDEWGIYNDTILFIYDTDDGDRILEDDIVTIWGQSLGLYTYTSVLGSEITVPAIDAKYISINNTDE